MNDDSSRFYERVPVFDRFTGIVDPARYQPLPDDWQLGLADVVQSTKAIREHRFKAVNMAGASVIAAVANGAAKAVLAQYFGGWRLGSILSLAALCATLAGGLAWFMAG